MASLRERILYVLNREHSLHVCMCCGVAAMHAGMALVGGLFVDYGLYTQRQFALMVCIGSAAVAVLMTAGAVFAGACREYFPSILIGSATMVFTAVEFIYAVTVVTDNNPMVVLCIIGCVIAMWYLAAFACMIHRVRKVTYVAI
jgi:hypothetical protein